MSLDLVDFKRNNWGLYIFIAIVVLAIIFLPDLISGKKETPVVETEQSEVKEDLQSAGEENVVKEEVDAYVDPLAIKGDGKEASVVVEEKKQIKASDEVEHKNDVNSQEREEGGNDSESASPLPQATQKPLLTLNSVTWQNLRESAVVNTLKELKVRAEGLATSLPSMFEDSRYSLYNFISGIDYLLGNNEHKLTALNALLYLEYLDKEVTKNFIKERVSRGYFVEWAHISLTRLLGRNSAETFKLMAQPDFDPAIVLTEVIADVPLHKVAKRDADPITRVSNFRFKGMVVGNDVATVEVFRSGELVKRFDVRKVQKPRTVSNESNSKFSLNLLKRKKTSQVSTNNPSDDIFNFEIGKAKVDGLYTIRVTNIEGYTAVKTYKFDNIFSLRRWRIDDEKNYITFAYSKTSKHPTRVDDAFSLIKKSLLRTGFVEGGDNAGFQSY